MQTLNLLKAVNAQQQNVLTAVRVIVMISSSAGSDGHAGLAGLAGLNPVVTFVEAAVCTLHTSLSFLCDGPASGGKLETGACHWFNQ